MSTTAAPRLGSGPQSGPAFQQRLGLFDATMLIVGTMIGSGIFVTSVDIAREVGSAGWLLAVWALAGFMTIIGALSYAELAGMMPTAGGQYVYLREAYSPLWGFLYGWTCFLVIQTGSIAFVAVVFAKFLGVLVPALGTGEAAMLYQVEGLDFKLYLPFMSDAEGKPAPFFTMDKYEITVGHLVAVGVIVFLTALNCRGVQEGKIVQNLFTVAKTAALLLLIAVGIVFVGKPEVWQANLTNTWEGIYSTARFEEVKSYGTTGRLGAGPLVIALMVFGGATVGALFSADAWNNITFTAGEIRNPRRNLPLSLMLGTATVITLYLLANVAYVRALPLHGDEQAAKQLAAQARQAATGDGAGAAQAETLARDAARAAGIDQADDRRLGTAVMELWSPRFAVPFMAIAIMISTFGCVNGMILMGARLYYTMARDNLFFASVGTLNGRAVPAVGLVLQGLWSIVLVFTGAFGDLLDYVIFAVLIFYVLTVVGLFVLRRTRPDAERPVRAPGYPVLPALYVLLCAVICLDLLVVKPNYTWPGLMIVLTGIPVYFLWRLFGRRAPA